MASILFVHGINTRGEGWFRTLELVSQKAERFLPGVALSGCQWGETLGAYLHKDGASIPNYEKTGNAAEPLEDASRARWFLLAENPLLEIRILPEQRYIGAKPGIEIFTFIAPLAGNAKIFALLATWQVVGPWPDFINEISSDTEWKRVVESITQPASAACEKLARAVVAEFQRRLRADGFPTLAGAQRDQLKDALVDPLGGPPFGIGDWLLDRLTGIAERRRGKISDLSTPAAGDVIRYQSRSEEITKFIAQKVKDTSANILLAHSLGGIAAVDWLASPRYAAEGPPIDRLITVGSQAPFFYEIDALVSRSFGAGLPASFPKRWLNIYDPADFLSYLAAPLFPQHARDVKVDNGQPFPDSHSAYWHNEKVWNAIAAFVSES